MSIASNFLVCADLHLSDYPPRCRVNEIDWLEAQLRVLREISEIALKHCVTVIVAGDFFDKSKVSPKLEAAVIKTIRNTGAIWKVIPGQHDLPGHSEKSIDESSLNVLFMSHVLNRETMLSPCLYGEDWITAVNKSPASFFVVHDLLWLSEPFPGAPARGNVVQIDKQITKLNKQKRLIISGDNHTPFEYGGKNADFVNCGSAIRRTADQIDHKPSVVLVDSVGGYDRIYLDIANDVFEIPENVKQKNRDSKDAEMQAFIKTLNNTSVDKELSLDCVLEMIYEQEHTTEPVRALVERIRRSD